MNVQKKQMKMGAEFQRKDGRVHHLFLPGFEKVDDSWKISSFSGNLEELETEKEKTEELFEPEVYYFF